MNPQHQEELERLIDAEITEQNLDPVSPITLWYNFEADLREMHSEHVNRMGYGDGWCNECAEDSPCPTIKLFDKYLRESS